MENLTINGRYRILQQIGVGGFGLTYLAEDLQLPTRPKSVVKHLKPQITDTETMNLANRLFQQEAEVLYRLGGHPNIPSLIAHFKENGEFFLVQEFIEGHTLDREFLGGRKYNQKEIIQFLGQTLEILSFVHSQKVIHRDIKPANLIRRNSDGNIFLIDFGAVKQVNAMPRTTNGATFSSITIGSHGYMAMEQMAGNPNFSSDLYALGLVAIEALTGIKPLDLPKNGTTNEIVWSHKAQLSPELERFISKLIRLDFRQRYVSATEALHSLNAIAANIGFFNSRPQVPVMATIQPIVGNQNFQPAAINQNFQSAPLPMTNPQFVPPTIIVPAQTVSINNPPRNFQNHVVNPPKSSSGKAVVFGVAGILFFIGFLFIAGKVLNFRWSSLGDSDDGRQNSRQTEITSPNSSGVSLYNEALKQAEEAQTKEKNATTKYEWDEIGNKYKRAYNLLMTIDRSNPYYEQAQAKIDEYKQKANLAEDRALNSPAGINNNPQKPTEISMPAAVPESNPSSKTVRAKLTMPPKPSAQNYLTFNTDNGYDVRNSLITSNDKVFASRIEKDSYNQKGVNIVEISAGGTRIRFKPQSYSGKLKPGTYQAVQESSNQPVMNTAISLDQFYCYQGANHSFTINSIVYDDLYQNVSYLDATFTLSCGAGYGDRKLMGRVHYDAR